MSEAPANVCYLISTQKAPPLPFYVLKFFDKYIIDELKFIRYILLTLDGGYHLTSKTRDKHENNNECM